MFFHFHWFQLKEIRFSNKGYYATQTYFANDIAILILQGKIEISPTVLPACVDWIHTEKYSPPEGTPGKVIISFETLPLF